MHRTSYTAVTAAQLLIACVSLTMLPGLAFAGVDTPMGNVLCTVGGWFTGNLGTAIEILSVVIVGILAMLGKVSWGMVLLDVVAASLIHSAGDIMVNLNAGVTSGC